MIAVDTNILVHAHRLESPRHAAAKQRLESLARGPADWAIPAACLVEFVRVITHPRVFDPPHTEAEARSAVEALLEAPNVRVLCPAERFVRLFLEAVSEGGARGNLVFDAAIVAVCREWGARSFLTEDRDFDRFRGFRTERLG